MGFTPGRESRSIAFVAALVAALLAAAPVAFARPCRIGTAGEYPMGWEGMLSRLGIPHERIWLHNNDDLDVLKKYDVVFLTCPSAAVPNTAKTFLEYIKGGGRGVIELWRYHRFPLFEGKWVESSGRANQQVVAKHPITRYLNMGEVIACGGRRYPYDSVIVPENDKYVVLMRYTDEKLEGGPGSMAQLLGAPACVLAKVGQGEVVHVGSRAGFVVGWDIEDPEPLVRGIIEYLCRGLTTPRFVGTRESEWVPSTELVEHPAGEESEGPAFRKPPIIPGYEATRPPYSDRYNVSARLLPPESNAPQRELIFDLQGTTTYCAVELSARSYAVVKVTLGRRVVVAQGELPQVPSEGLRFLLIRRPDTLRLVLGDWVAVRYPWANQPSGFVYFRAAAKGGKLRDVRCQRVADVVFSDDFTREANEQDTWEALSGQWKKTGVPESPQSINGFAFTGKSSKPGIARSGSWWWERYTVSAAARPEDKSTAVGLCFEVKDASHYCVLRLQPRGEGSRVQLVWVKPEGETVLASAPGGCVAGQWSRLAVRLTEGQIEGFVDGVRLVVAPDPTDGLGAMGLYVAGGEATFDDVDVSPSGPPNSPLPYYKGEGGPKPRLPRNVGPTDYMTWASRAVEWVGVAERPTLFWHRGVYFGDVALRLIVPASTGSTAERALYLSPTDNPATGLCLRLGPAEADGTRQVWATVNGEMVRTADVSLTTTAFALMEVARRGDKLVATWEGNVVATAPAFAGGARLGVEVIGPPIRVADLDIETTHLRDYNFAAAPADWWVGSGEWRVHYRWDCEKRWSWYSGSSKDVAVIWNKHRFEGDQVLDFYVGVAMTWKGIDETKRARDLNCVICGDGKDPKSGYSLVLGGTGGLKTTLSRNGKVVASTSEARVPGGRAVHHQWHHIQMRKIGNKISVFLENRPILEYEDPDPLPGGYMGIWTRNNSILVARVSIFYEREAPDKLLSLLP